MKKIKCLLIVILAIISITTSISAQNTLFFSTEEDFITKSHGIVSDGDLLNWDGTVYMRNKELVVRYDEVNDLGLDASDVIDIKGKIVAFSTELDSTHGIFTAGDLISTNGALITNRALLVNFTVPTRLGDIGLDAVQFIGNRDAILKFLDYVALQGWDYYKTMPQNLPNDLKQYGLDIWFSTEGTSSLPDNPLFLDGDVLSVVSGAIVFSNDILLPNTVPAGLPSRGVDYGLDALLASRDANKTYVHFSTEILNYKPLFTDGDLLRLATPGIVLTNPKIIEKFYARTQFLGLDALSYFER